MKFSSALTMTTVLSVLSVTHGAPVVSIKDEPSQQSTHHRRASSVSELAGRDYSGSDLMDSLNFAYEPGNGIKTLLNFVKRQIGSTDSGTSPDSSSSTATQSNVPETSGHSEVVNNGGTGLMGGNMRNPQEAGFAFEPGQAIKAT